MKTILLVEDNEDVRELVGLVLRNGGYEVCEAENGRDALDQLDAMSAAPCLLLLDLMMPVMSGQELLQILDERHLLNTMPVVVLSAGGQPTQVPSAKRFIRKPVDPKTILAMAQELCGNP